MVEGFSSSKEPFSKSKITSSKPKDIHLRRRIRFGLGIPLYRSILIKFRFQIELK